MTLREGLYREILFSLNNNYGNDNYDADRYGSEAAVATNDGFLKGFIKKQLSKYNYVNDKTHRFAIENIHRAITNYERYFDYFEYLYNLLENDESKDLLVKILAYRVLGYKKVKLPVNTPQYWKDLAFTDQLKEGNEEIDPKFLDFKLSKYNLRKINYPITIFHVGLGILIDFMLEQYKYYSDVTRMKIEVGNGDVVLDCGACFGDTALYFAHKTGASGKVFSFEFIPDNIEIFKKNVSLNPELTNRIELVDLPLWSVSGKTVYYVAFGPASQVSFEPIKGATGTTITTTIDDVVKDKKIAKVDFIKMDIEGAELNALQGAIETIRVCKPKLAITLYHRPEDFGNITRYIHELNLGYKFYLGHYTIHQEETVLFAIAK